ncbi:MAG: response regulator [bacterium]
MDGAFTILIADRSRALRETLRREFLREGYAVRAARDVGEVWTVIRHFQPTDLLILDLEIPAAGGWGLLQKLRRETPWLPLVVLYTPISAYAVGKALTCASALLLKDLSRMGRLKGVVAELLSATYPYRFPSRWEIERPGLAYGRQESKAERQGAAPAVQAGDDGSSLALDRGEPLRQAAALQLQAETVPYQ